MAERYIACDSGKFATKLATYNPKTENIKLFKFRTKSGTGSFEDDSLERNTMIVEINGQTYKIGNGASTQAELNTSKQSEIHKICTLTAIAMCTSNDEVDNVHVAIGIPVKEWEVVEKRNAYKKYMLPEGEISVVIKAKAEDEPIKKTFNIVSRYVFPESMGALYLDKMGDYMDNTAAVIDIGNLNINCTLWNALELDKDYSLTDELGGNILIAGLSQELSAKFGRCDENHVAKLLTLPREQRYLRPNNPNPEVEKKSKQLVDEYLLKHVKEIRRKCDAKHWSLDFMELVFIGGTSQLLKDEIKQVFGNAAHIPENPEYANVIGFLRILCAKTLDKIIPLPGQKKEGVEAEKSA